MNKQIVFIGKKTPPKGIVAVVIPELNQGFTDNVLEYGKVYDVAHETNICYYLRNELGGLNSYLREDFITLEEWRNNKLNELLK